MTRKLSLLAMLVALPLALSAQDDDMYFVSSKKKAEPKVTRQQESHTASTNAEGARWQQTPEAEANADYHTGQLRDVDEYNRRGAGCQVLARLDGDTLYVQGQDSLEQKEYLVRYENQYVADEPYADDYYFATRLHRYYGYYHYDPFMWDICYGWYDPWYDPWYGWYGPYYRHGWYSWNTWGWGWGWGYYHTGWHHGWDYGWHHGWGHAAPYYSYHAYHSYRPGGSASANGGRRAGSLRGGNLTSSGRAYAAPARGGRNTVSTSRSTIGADGRRYSTTPSRSQSRQASTSTRSTTRSTTTTSRSTSRNNTYTAPSRSSSSRSSSGSYSSGTRSSGSSSGGFSGGRSGGGFSGGGSRGGGGRGGR